jgi:hypothetical protein
MVPRFSVINHGAAKTHRNPGSTAPSGAVPRRAVNAPERSTPTSIGTVEAR